MPTDRQSQLLRALPPVDRLMSTAAAAAWLATHPRAAVLSAVRGALDAARSEILSAATDEELANVERSVEDILAAAEESLQADTRGSPVRVINATGIIVHTNLGRSLLAREAIEAMATAAGAHCNLEMDLETGERGSRHVHVEPLLCRVTGAEAGIAVNNNAAAVLLALNTLADGREVIVSRGQLVEIGGSFRMPDVMAKSGCSLVEVGTTNRTRVVDYQNAITDQTAAIMVVHASNFRMVGFVEEPSVSDLAALARRHGLRLIHDLGSGALVDVQALGVGPEPIVRDSLAAGADVVTFSADKLLGGPQAGVIVGRSEPLQAIRANPLARALRLDKTIIAALAATLRLYSDEESAIRTIPTLRQAAEPAGDVRRRALRLRRLIADVPAETEVVRTDSYVGGGSLPGRELPSWAVAVTPRDMSVDRLSARLRSGAVPLIARVHQKRLLLDARTLQAREVKEAAGAIRAALVGEPR